MMQFSTIELMDEQKCYDFLVNQLHPCGLHCPTCGQSVNAAHVHRWDRKPVLYYRCPCGCVYNAFAATELKGIHYSCSTIVRILQGFVHGVSTRALAMKIDVNRMNLLQWRHHLQAFAEKHRGRLPLFDTISEADEAYINAGEKRSSAYRSERSSPTPG